MPPGVNGDCSAGVVEALDARDMVRVNNLVARGARVACVATSRRLETAVRDRRINDLRLLLEGGADPNLDTGEFLGYPDLVALALEHRDEHGFGLAAARILLSHGASPNRRMIYRRGLHTRRADDSGQPYEAYDVELFNATLLIVAALEGNVEVVRLLLEFNADRSAQDSKSRTALDYARDQNHADVVALLTRAQAGPRRAG